MEKYLQERIEKALNNSFVAVDTSECKEQPITYFGDISDNGDIASIYHPKSDTVSYMEDIEYIVSLDEYIRIRPELLKKYGVE